MRILIIGGTGFIGPAPATQLASMGHPITVFHRGQTTAELPASVNHTLGKRQDIPQLAEAFRRFAPDVVVDVTRIQEPRALSFDGALSNTFRPIGAPFVETHEGVADEVLLPAAVRATVHEPNNNGLQYRQRRHDR